MTRTERQAAIHQDAAENSAWDAFFTGVPMNWLTGEREVQAAQEARQHITPTDKEQREEEARHDLLAAEWDAASQWILRLAGALLAAFVLGAVL